MATEAPTHIHPRNGMIDGHLTHITVAPFTVQSLSDVNAVSEIDKAGKPIHARPRDRLIAGIIIGDLLNSRGTGRDDLVATHALVNRWNASDRRTQGVGVTIETGDPDLHHRDVGKVNGLLWRRLGLRSRKKIDSNYHDAGDEQDTSPLYNAGETNNSAHLSSSFCHDTWALDEGRGEVFRTNKERLFTRTAMMTTLTANRTTRGMRAMSRIFPPLCLEDKGETPEGNKNDR